MQCLTFTNIQTLLSEDLALGKRNENIHHGIYKAGGDKFDRMQDQWRYCTKQRDTAQVYQIEINCVTNNSRVRLMKEQ